MFCQCRYHFLLNFFLHRIRHCCYIVRWQIGYFCYYLLFILITLFKIVYEVLFSSLTNSTSLSKNSISSCFVIATPCPSFFAIKK